LLVLLVLTAGWVVLTQWVFPPLLFRKAVLNPIPASVHHIKGSGFLQTWGRHTYVLRFHIGPEDVPRILASDELKEIAFVQYRRGDVVVWDTRFSYRSFPLFEGWRAWVPRPWCQWARWRAFRAYCVREESVGYWKDVVFLYDPGTGEAYFIHRLVTHWGWSLF
jgi:hypothetical protein